MKFTSYKILLLDSKTVFFRFFSINTTENIYNEKDMYKKLSHDP